jgi:perosamine synthetase
MSEQIPLFEIPWDIEDIKNVSDSVGRGGYWAKGPYIEQFEEQVAEYLDIEYAIAVNSGTSALMAALEAVGIDDGDEVIVPSFTQQATANAVKMVGGKPIFADIERDTYGLDPEDVAERITEDTEVIMPVHVYGSVCKIEKLNEIAEEHDLTVVEDAAEALGATRDGQYAGTFGDVAGLSFCQNKIVPTGEGGMVVTDDDDIAEIASLYRSHGRTTTDYFETSKSGQHVIVGGNFRMPDIVAALGCSQMAKIDEFIDGRKNAAQRMNEAFETMEGIEPHSFDGSHVYQFYTVTFDKSIERDKIIETLSGHQISAKVYWDPAIHQSEMYQDTRYRDELPVTEEMTQRVLSLPMHPKLSEKETDRIVDAIQEGINSA